MVHTAAAPAPMVAAAPAPAMVHSVAAPEVLAAPAPPAMVHTTTAAPMVHTAAAVLAAAPAVHTVTVGGSSLVFTPSSVTAAVGDVVTFVFLAKNHTVTQSTFAKPCVKLAPDGKDSGFMPNPAGDAAAAPTFDFTVSALEPSWWYCRQKTPTSHCGAGMVFAINPTAEKSFETFLAEAKKQNGTATAAADVAATAPVTLSVDNGGVAAATMTTAAAAVVAAPPVATETVVAPGWNAQGNAQACNCACFCGVGAFPQGDGVGAYGGYSGSLPAPWG
ncbi:hypothetical protein EDC01DRAFT_662622 [Geopyxis carbonaria]|nr:hypothetical protein EDC01DRAFT_662622 [Geopyxis carbonaria]